MIYDLDHAKARQAVRLARESLRQWERCFDRNPGEDRDRYIAEIRRAEERLTEARSKLDQLPRALFVVLRASETVEEPLMPNLVTELIREYKKSLLARRRAGSLPAPTQAVAPKKLLARWPAAKPHRPQPDHRLRESHL
jgi:hypothetical protein